MLIIAFSLFLVLVVAWLFAACSEITAVESAPAQRVAFETASAPETA